MNPSQSSLKIQDLDHCGMVASPTNQLELVEIVNQKISTESEAMTAIAVTYGYLRNHRPNLKQFMADLICSGNRVENIC